MEARIQWIGEEQERGQWKRLPRNKIIHEGEKKDAGRMDFKKIRFSGFGGVSVVVLR